MNYRKQVNQEFTVESESIMKEADRMHDGKWRRRTAEATSETPCGLLLCSAGLSVSDLFFPLCPELNKKHAWHYLKNQVELRSDEEL